MFPVSYQVQNVRNTWRTTKTALAYVVGSDWTQKRRFSEPYINESSRLNGESFRITQQRDKENMVYFDSWHEFAAAVEQLCVAEPNRVKFTLFSLDILKFIQSIIWRWFVHVDLS